MKKKIIINSHFFIAITFTLFILLLWFGSWYCIDLYIKSDSCELTNIEAAGSFGDKFGAINSLFSGLAFGGIIFTILLQRKELELQREELRETRDVFKSQNNTLETQKFENTFFQMLNLFHSIVNSLEIRNNGSTEIVYSGRDCFDFFVKELKKNTEEYLVNKNIKKIFDNPLVKEGVKDLSKEEIIGMYDNVYQKYKSSLSHYFRTLYHIIKFIDESNIQNKRRYISIVRAQLSSYEQVMLLYNCIHPNGNKRFKPLIERYTLFDNIDSNELLDIDHYNNPIYFSKKAFE